ncbi:GTP-binding protein [Epilithonimonas ginsengisoli]|uniref:sulfate adenylyltransferase n=1 Tax=Epilithonimonas ginsengisoli TaxID=1245592 RepID=A0ABU4JMK1_9FLAO|nr:MULTISPECIES: GTP-binding protein [Chryseobacterium group]MBV6881743.1 sulfate adenylyltransferase [Epilithonimonas sp. FP105]MDW8550779.1 GTP-binding protein [Epilithonimonas ginsengisoli]OAH68197.1 sulfate adenylyltransferase [Chryseobacterium sp. FP211-J200]
MDILRFITAGSVDDGKSTLIGRLLYDSKNILIDQLEAVERASKFKNDGELDLALLTDGLRAEREQGITIDVAYKYFSTPKRKFIIADAPGHVQYTRNMITGASNAALIIILIDARNGIIEQTRRHSIIASLLNIPNVVVAINKLDLVNYSEEIFINIKEEYSKIAEQLSLNNVVYIPISALDGDNIVDRSEKLDWYQGKTLLDHLETVELENTINLEKARFPVQYVIRPQSEDYHDYRGYAGKITNGIYKVGDEVTILPSGTESKISAIEIDQKNVKEAFAPQSVILHLETDVDISRGDLIVKSNDLPKLEQELEVLVCWMGEKPLKVGSKYLIQNNTTQTKAVIRDIEYKLDVNTLEKHEVEQVSLNEIVKLKLKTAKPFAFDAYKDLASNGGIIFIDETSFVTVGAGLIQ